MERAEGLIASNLLDVPPLVARYRAVFWEPVPGTGERLVALVAFQAHESSAQAISPGTLLGLSPGRLRQLLGRQRGHSSLGVLRECARYMTERQKGGLPLDEVRPLFHGFELGPVMVARAWSIEQLLDAAVRSVSVFASADDMLEDEDTRPSVRHTVRTAEFLTALRRIFTGADKSLASRFDVPLRGRGAAPDVVIDYAHGPFAVQVASLPTTAKQAEHAEREAQAKLFELEVARRQMQGNPFRPALLFNTDALSDDLSSEARKHAQQALDRLGRFARFNEVEVLQASSAPLAARLLDVSVPSAEHS